MCSSIATSSVNRLRMKEKLEFQKVMTHAHRDIDFLLKLNKYQSFVDNSELDEVKNTLKELRQCTVGYFGEELNEV